MVDAGLDYHVAFWFARATGKHLVLDITMPLEAVAELSESWPQRVLGVAFSKFP